MNPKPLATALLVLAEIFSSSAHADLPLGYTFTFIPELGWPLSINNAGQVLGSTSVEQGSGLLWENGNISPLGGIVSSLNNSGQIAGSISGHAVVWNGNVPAPLPGLANDGESAAIGINDMGQVSGWSDSPSGHVPVVWNGTTPNALLPAGEVVGINNHGQVLGQFDFGTSNKLSWHPVIWQGNNFTDLGALNGRDINMARSINDAGQVVGFSYDESTYDNHAAFLWENGGMTQLAAPGSYADALDINNHGQIVGQSGSPFDPGADSLAVIWDKGKMYDLSGYINPHLVEDGWAMLLASSINDKGQIIGFGFNRVTNVSGTFLLTPIPEPETYAMFTAGLGVISLVARRRKRTAVATECV
ncbi:MAG TPA: PEP-CTERM sorting domain-containing protein [Methylophilaceae bacterium]|nr:PEP-CTERM sorting domain-containing protein [Methylophilaceae bacterium]